MDPRKLFADDRMTGVCVYCGGLPSTRDHVPSRILLDAPLPPNLPVVDCCAACNFAFSLDEQYVACLITCVIAGSTSPHAIARPKIARILTDTPALAAKIASAERRNSDGQLLWQPEIDRVHSVILKLARGHAAYELSVIQLDEPVSVTCMPVVNMNHDQLQTFLSSVETPFWPEIGSRAFIQASKDLFAMGADQWNVVQPGKYQYLVSQAHGLLVRILINDYLACEVNWD